MRTYSQSCVVVFDGYPDYPTTKGEDQRRRAAHKTTADLMFDGNMKTCTSQSDFLGNSNNKKRFISQLADQLQVVGFAVVKADDDADTVIVQQALLRSNIGQSLAIVGADTASFVLLSALSSPGDDVFIIKPVIGTTQQKVYSSKEMIKHLGDMRHIILCTGCDTTSALYGKGKRKALDMLAKNSQMTSVVSVFNHKEATEEQIAEAGELFLLKLYGSVSLQDTTLDVCRFTSYKRLNARLSLTSNFNLASLPPTSAAARQHSLRVFFQVQHWIENKLDPTTWSWKLDNNDLIPVTSLIPPVPDKLLKLISCNCKKSCQPGCACRQIGLNYAQQCVDTVKV